MAAENGHLAIVEALLEASAKINCLIFDSCLTPLHLALSKVSCTTNGCNQSGIFGGQISSFFTHPHPKRYFNQDYDN